MKSAYNTNHSNFCFILDNLSFYVSKCRFTILFLITGLYLCIRIFKKLFPNFQTVKSFLFFTIMNNVIV